MKWFVKCDVEGIHTEIHTTYQSALESIRAKCGDSYYLDVEFKDTEEFVKWMNKDFLNPYDHGHYCKIHKMNDEKYWQNYLRPLGADIAWGIATGVEFGMFYKTSTWVQYIEDDCKFISFETKEEFFSNIMSLEDILEELKCRY